MGPYDKESDVHFGFKKKVYRGLRFTHVDDTRLSTGRCMQDTRNGRSLGMLGFLATARALLEQA